MSLPFDAKKAEWQSLMEQGCGVVPPSLGDERREERRWIPHSGMDGMPAWVDALAMLERGISGSIFAEHLAAQPGSRFKASITGRAGSVGAADVCARDGLVCSALGRARNGTRTATQTVEATCLCETEKRMKVYFSCIIMLFGRLSQEKVH